MMLEYLGEQEAADVLLEAIENVLGGAKSGELEHGMDLLTPDMGGKGNTESLGKAIENAIRQQK